MNSPSPLAAPASWDRWSPLARRGVVAAVAVALMVWAFLRWRHGQAVFDDAFISYRYARNLVAGHGLVFNPGEHVEGYTNFLWIALLAQAIFVAKVGGDFMEYRLMWEYWPVLVAGAAVGAFELLRRSLALTALALAASLALAQAPVVLEMEHGMQSVQEMDGIAQRTRLVGVALNAALPPDTVIATRAAGMAYFLPGLRVIDQWGLNDPVVSHSPVPGIRTRGHVKQASRDYLVARGVNLEFGHPMLCRCSQPRKQTQPNVFIRLSSADECVRSRYLTPTAELTRHFCSHPERFVLYLVDCPAPAGPTTAPAAGNARP